ncbi:hypothetical protein H4Q26_006063 [Puccinia striiformis f. sp. tritici PST-130]|nr:hypothetical protein H4Q26_006063 [Puccinia striiformis f. sp. tritici PST-130]
MDQQQPGSSSVNRTLYPPSQPAPLYLDAENDYNHYLDEELISYNDPDQHLRLTRSATETIHEAISEDDRRRLAKKNRSNHNKRNQQQLLSAHNHPLPTNSIFNSKLNSKNSANQLNSQQQQHNHDPSGSSSNPPTQKFIPPMPIAPELDQDEEEADEHTRNLKELEDSPAADLQRKQTDSSRQQRRSIYVNLVLPTVQVDKYGDPIARYVRNKVRTTKYTIITFFPKNMWEQFRNVANVYFLVLIIFQVFPIFGAATPQVAMLPLCHNAACTKLGDWRNVNVPKAGGGTWFIRSPKGYENYAKEKGYVQYRFLRANDSQRQNSSEFRDDDALSDIQEGTAYQPGHSISSLPPPSTYRRRPSSDLVDYSTPTAGTAKWERTLWKKIEVGDILLLREDEAIPADLIVLSTSDPDGQCFVETKNLDGETNLKPRRACKTTRSIGNEEDVEHSHFVIESEAPNANLYAFNASVKYWTKDETEGQEHPLTEGRKLKKDQKRKKNTQWVIGLVIFTGKDTKIMLNQGDTPSKKPKISTETNYAVVVNFLILVLLCTVNAVGDGILQGTVKTSATFYEAGASVSSNAVLDALVTFGCLDFISIYRTISLVITLEFVRSIQALTIFRDIEMYYEPLNCPAEPKSWNLSDDLGQIEYIFSDKTAYPNSPQLIEDLTNPHPTNSVHRKRMLDFWKTLAICHDVISSRNDLEPNQIEYKAESPDEAALVAAARDVGFVFLRRMGERLEIQAMGQLEQYHMLQMIAFNSSRKRMSTIPDQDEDLKRRVNQDLESFASDGLRTLLIASREVSEEEYLEFQQEYKQASDSIGATALEDKLQVGVPEAIEKLHEAGIKLWILTGDKLQTAIEIGYSCNLLKSTMEIMILSSDTEAGTRSQIEQGLEKLLSTASGSATSTPPSNGHEIPDRNNNDPIDNKSSPTGRRKSQAVFPATRPKDGYAVVIDGDTLRYALDGSSKLTFWLSLFNAKPSCNDVAMIQEAHIGVGIAGLEGAQASMSADYALGQFRFLTKLLLFYFVFTSLPVGLMGAFEQDLSANASMAFPALYKRGIYGLQYTRLKFWSYMLDGTYQSIVSFWIPYFVYFHSTSVSITGRDVSIWEFGATVACGTVFAANNLIAINTRYFPWFIIIVLTVSSTLVLEIIIGESYKHQHAQTGLEEDMRQLKLIEQVIEKDKADRSACEQSVTKKQSQSSSPSYALAPGGGGAAIPTATLTGVGRTTSVNRKSLSKGFHHQGQIIDIVVATSSPGPSPREHFNRNGVIIISININNNRLEIEIQKLVILSSLKAHLTNLNLIPTTKPIPTASTTTTTMVIEDFITCNSHPNTNNFLLTNNNSIDRWANQSTYLLYLPIRGTESDYNPPSIHSNLHPSLSTPPLLRIILIISRTLLSSSKTQIRILSISFS